MRVGGKTLWGGVAKSLEGEGHKNFLVIKLRLFGSNYGNFRGEGSVAYCSGNGAAKNVLEVGNVLPKTRDDEILHCLIFLICHSCFSFSLGPTKEHSS